MTYSFKITDSPVGSLKLVAGASGLVAVVWEDDNPRRVQIGPMIEDRLNPILTETEHQLGEYFSGRRTRFELPLHFMGTEFQTKVWQALVRIPFGEVRSYGQIARDLGLPKASRAVGAANGRNPIAIVAPCHRVIGASGALTGFAGGLEAKAKLLALEGRDFGSNATAKSRRRAAIPTGREMQVELPGIFQD